MIEFAVFIFIYHHRTNFLPSFHVVLFGMAMSLALAYLYQARKSALEERERVWGCQRRKRKSKAKMEIEEEVGSHVSLLALFYHSEVFP